MTWPLSLVFWLVLSAPVGLVVGRLLLKRFRAWGFRFIRSEVFIWVKSREGYSPKLAMGYWSRNGGEIAALFTRGSPKRLSKGVEQIIHCPRGAHSAKPDLQYERIEALVGGPYLELFARSARPNWSAWGNEVGVRDGSLAELWNAA